MSETKICLSVICKNEEAVALRMLETVYPILDYYIVVDTGSTDKTKEIVENFFKEKGIPGKVIDHEWVNFETARNFALQEAKKTGCSHSFWIDFDEQLILDPKFDKSMLKQALSNVSGATIEVQYGTTRYNRNQFWSNTDNWYWYGPVHEVLNNDKPSKPMGFVRGMYTLVTPDGSSWTKQTQQQKYEDHAKLLEEYVKNDPKQDSRWVFYLAQSYRDAVTAENAIQSIKWYSKRRDMLTGFQEERYYSQLMVATQKAKVNEIYVREGKEQLYPNYEIEHEFLKCADYDQLRAEHFIPLIKHYQITKRWHSAYIISEYAFRKFHRKNPYPNRGLFIDPETYLWKIADCHSISSWYVGNLEESKRAFNQAMKSLQKGEISSQADVNRIQGNLEFYKNQNKNGTKTTKI